MIEDLRAHIAAKLQSGRIEHSPFPHMVIQEFFPADVYERIMEYNLFRANPGSEWLSKSESSKVTGRTPYHTRKQINFHKNDEFEATPEARAFWREITDTFLADDWFSKQVYAAYPEYFRLRFGDLVDDEDFFALCREELFLQRHEPGYNIGPHTDIPTRIFTCIFAFATGPGFEHFGTELLAPKERLNRCWGHDHYPTDGFVVKKVAPYSANNFLLFFKTRHSFHSVRAIDDTVPNQRYGMQFQFYEPRGGLFHDLSRPDLMSVGGSNRTLTQKILAKVGL